MNKLSIKIMEISGLKQEHSHNYAQIIIPIESAIFLQTSASDYLIDENYIGFIPPNIFHKYNAEKGNKALIINIPNPMVKKSDINSVNEINYIPMTPKLQNLLLLIRMEIIDSPDSESAKYLYFYLYDQIMASKISKSIEFIAKHYLEPIHISDLATIEHYNENYYRDWFKKQTGTTPKLYIQKLRIEKAKELLTTTHYSIQEIGLQVGYDHSSSFNRSFKQLESIGPKEYRNLNT